MIFIVIEKNLVNYKKTIMFSFTTRNVHISMIKFIGKRTKTNKHLGVYTQQAAAAVTSAGTPDSEKKSLSMFASMEFADYPADRWARLPFSEEEQDMIN